MYNTLSAKPTLCAYRAHVAAKCSVIQKVKKPQRAKAKKKVNKKKAKRAKAKKKGNKKKARFSTYIYVQ